MDVLGFKVEYFGVLQEVTNTQLIDGCRLKDTD